MLTVGFYISCSTVFFVYLLLNFRLFFTRCLEKNHILYNHIIMNQKFLHELNEMIFFKIGDIKIVTKQINNFLMKKNPFTWNFPLFCLSCILSNNPQVLLYLKDYAKSDFVSSVGVAAIGIIQAWWGRGRRGIFGIWCWQVREVRAKNFSQFTGMETGDALVVRWSRE